MRLAIRTLLVLVGLLAAAPATALAAPPAGVTGMAGDARVEIALAAGGGRHRLPRVPRHDRDDGHDAADGQPDEPAGPGVTPSFTDLTAANGTTYYYAVRATVGGVESANSAVIQATPRARTCTGPNPVVQENCFPGSADWDTDLPTGMDGFATASSINKGGSVGLKLQAGTGATVDVEIFRSGYYGGAGARLFSTLLAVPVSTQPGCVSTASLGLLDCSNWTVNATLTTTASWPSGMYLLRVTRRDTGRNTHIPLVVRDDGRDAQVLYGIPDTSYQAYNYWGGKSLYDDKSTGVQTVAGTARAVKVSFDRPYQAPHDDILRDWYTRADYPAVSWLEKRGLRRRLHRGLRPRALRRRGARPPRLHLRRPRRVLVGRHAHRARAGARRGRRPLLHRRQRACTGRCGSRRARCPRRRTA